MEKNQENPTEITNNIKQRPLTSLEISITYNGYCIRLL